MASNADIIILDVKPQEMGNVLDEISAVIPEEKTVVSIAAGITLSYLSARLRTRKIVRIMPNTPALIQEGMSVMSMCECIHDKDIAMIKDIFMSVGRLLSLPEKYMDAVTALSGSGPAFIAYFVEAMIEGAVRVGLSKDDAATLATQTLLGTARLLDTVHESFQTQRDGHITKRHYCSRARRSSAPGFTAPPVSQRARKPDGPSRPSRASPRSVQGLEVNRERRGTLVPEPQPRALEFDAHHGVQPLLESLGATTRAVLVGLLLSSTLGVAAAVALASSPWMKRAFYPYAIFFQIVPIVAIAPLLVIWFGYGPRAVVAAAAVVSIFPVIANTLAGLVSVDPALADLFRLHGASRLATLPCKNSNATPMAIQAAP